MGFRQQKRWGMKKFGDQYSKKKQRLGKNTVPKIRGYWHVEYVYKAYLTGTVPVNKMHLTGTVPENKLHLTGSLFLRVPKKMYVPKLTVFS